jgi:hypothetical protein
MYMSLNIEYIILILQSANSLHHEFMVVYILKAW